MTMSSLIKYNARDLLALGTHEAEVSYGGEADLLKNFKTCKKNPQHKNFIPAGEFQKAHLPERYHDDDIFDLTNTLIDLTVRVISKFTCKERPKYFPDTTVPYPFFNNIGEKHLWRTGTGRIWDVRKMSQEDAVDCPCSRCQASLEPVREWGQVNVITATHVIFNVDEARESFCRIDYNTDNGSYIEIEGWGRDGSDIIEDRYLLTCVTHNIILLDRLRKLVDHYNDICYKVYKKYLPTKEQDRLTIVVSHPHGCGKRVSFGDWKERFFVGNGTTKYSYSSATCPGSSGAPIYMLGRSGWRWMYYHVHSSANESVNISGLGWEH
ncbi:hypothetical protein Bpfe_002791 [Biomphalaria pfeifferi]|uniref:Peptidase S1 domain-containing protein n=1 Tax=Biomphalaria pfeifferi TaxID=112525 RepID=A0AAD8C9L9_BIOPF|nr:hypothetical protein Bpfe_002791 [Biomphalaria pfeifferi]